MIKKYLAHTENDLDEVHDLDDHLKCVGKLAEHFISGANKDLGEASKWAGLLHDLGKYREEFQEYLIGKREAQLTHITLFMVRLWHIKMLKDQETKRGFR